MQGLQGLYVSVDQLGKEVEGIGHCKLVEHLATNGTKITCVGVKLSIHNLPSNLKCWEIVLALKSKFIRKILLPSFDVLLVRFMCVMEGNS